VTGKRPRRRRNAVMGQLHHNQYPFTCKQKSGVNTLLSQLWSRVLSILRLTDQSQRNAEADLRE